MAFTCQSKTFSIKSSADQRAAGMVTWSMSGNRVQQEEWKIVNNGNPSLPAGVRRREPLIRGRVCGPLNVGKGSQRARGHGSDSPRPRLKISISISKMFKMTKITKMMKRVKTKPNGLNDCPTSACTFYQSHVWIEGVLLDPNGHVECG